MTRRTKIAIAAAVAILIALLLLLLFLRPQAPMVVVNTAAPISETPPPSLPSGTSSGTTPTPTPEAPKAPEIPAPPADDSASVRRLAAAFAERLGSYSNQSEFENVLDLKVFMTSTMAAWADRYAAEQRAKQGDATVYFGVTTRAISTEAAAHDQAGGKSRIMVKTQRHETKGDGSAPRVYYQDLRIDFLKQGETWKVDAAYWQ